MQNSDWQHVINLIKKAFQDNMQLDLFNLLLTHDEREALKTRVHIIEQLTMGNINQRTLKDHLGTGIATITRGSNNLKTISPEFRKWLIKNINKG